MKQKIQAKAHVLEWLTLLCPLYAVVKFQCIKEDELL